MNNPWLFLLVLVPAVGFAWVWFSRDRAHLEVGPVVFSDELQAKVRRARPFYRFGLLGPQYGRVHLLVGQETIATRLLPGFLPAVPRWLGALNLMDYTFRAADCEVTLSRNGERLSASKPGGSLVLRGNDSRGEIELVLSRPRTATLDDVRRELIRAGARPADRTFGR